jgi:hypothetical protein
MPAVVPMVMPPRAIPADPVRPVIGPDHPAVAVRIAVISGIIGRSVETPEVMPVKEVRPEVGLAIAAMVKCAVAATAEHGRGAKTAAVKTAAVKSTTVKASATVEATTSAVETAAAMTTTMTAANLDHRSVGRDFR